VPFGTGPVSTLLASLNVTPETVTPAGSSESGPPSVLARWVAAQSTEPAKARSPRLRNDQVLTSSGITEVLIAFGSSPGLAPCVPVQKCPPAGFHMACTKSRATAARAVHDRSPVRRASSRNSPKVSMLCSVDAHRCPVTPSACTPPRYPPKRYGERVFVAI